MEGRGALASPSPGPSAPESEVSQSAQSGTEEPIRFGAPPGNGEPRASATVREGADPESPPPSEVRAPNQESGGLPDRSVSGSSACSSPDGSSPESEEVFGDAEKSPLERKRVLRKTKSWKTFLAMVHWPLRRRGSWVQLAGHQGNFKPGEGGQILKRFSATEEACLARLMTDVLRPFVPAYRGVVEAAGERYIRMDDLLSGLDVPSVMDCKMGTRTYLEEEFGEGRKPSPARRDLYQKMVKVDPSAPTARERGLGAVTKRRYMQWREGIGSSATLGFRIEGVTVEGGAVRRDFKQTRTEEEIVEIFLTFTKGRRDVLSTYLARLESMRTALEESTFFKTHEVIGSYLLFLHDRQGHASVWMIDFGKTLPVPGGLLLRHDAPWSHGNHEDGYLVGLRHLTDTLRAALRKAEERRESEADRS